MATVRYMVFDVERAVSFYVDHLGFQPGDLMLPAFARVERDDLELWLAGPQSSAARAMPDGSQPAPGGWNRFVVQVDDLDATVASMRDAGVAFRNDIVKGPGGKQILVDDPDGNPIELFEARS
jgi:catechol 2,3-dioxygenase-like lactoylglutathione lyase family enzyme